LIEKPEQSNAGEIPSKIARERPIDLVLLPKAWNRRQKINMPNYEDLI